MRAWLAAALLVLSGCGTCYSIGARIQRESGPIVYSGVRFDAHVIVHPFIPTRSGSCG